METGRSIINRPSFYDSSFQIIQSNTEKTYVCVNTPVFTLIPSAFYVPEAAREYFRYTHNITGDDMIFENQLFSSNYHLLFPIKKNIVGRIQKKSREIEFYHYANIFVSRLLKTKQTESACVFINKQSTYFYLFIFKNKNILLLNSFKAIDDLDISFFTLNGLYANGINPKRAKLYYSGLADKNEGYVQILNKYMHSVSILSDAKI